MAEDKKQENKKQEKKSQEGSSGSKPAKGRPEQESHETLIRIMGYDLPGSKNLYSSLTRIKGISWSISNVVCIKLNYPRSTKISDLSKEDIAKIESFLKELPIFDFLKNRRTDPETGKTSHNFGTDLDITRDFDIKRMKKMKSYKGIRHTARLPVRGQRTRSHFRAKGRATGLGTKKKATSPVVPGAKK